MQPNDRVRIQPDQYIAHALQQRVVGNFNAPVAWSSAVGLDYFVAPYQPFAGPHYISSQSSPMNQLRYSSSFLQPSNPKGSPAFLHATRNPPDAATVLNISYIGCEGDLTVPNPDISTPSHTVKTLSKVGSVSRQPSSEQAYMEKDHESDIGNVAESGSEICVSPLFRAGPLKQKDFYGSPRNGKSTHTESLDTNTGRSHANPKHRQEQKKTPKTALASRKRKRDGSKPKRPLSSYNIFFKEERVKLIKEMEGHESRPSSNQDLVRENTSSTTIKQRKKNPHRKITFQAMAKIIADRWRNIDPQRLRVYDERAATDKQRYLSAHRGYLQKKLDEKRSKLEMTVSEETRRKYLAAAKPR